MKKVEVYIFYLGKEFCFPLVLDKEKQSLTEAIRMKILKDKVISVHSVIKDCFTGEKKVQRDIVFIDLRSFDLLKVLCAKDIK